MIEPDRTERHTVAPDIDLEVRRWEGGAGAAPFLLVHGLASNARLWDGVAVALAAAGHPVVAVDQRGHGHSSKPAGPYDMATVAADLHVLIHALGPEMGRPIVAGQSWGGNVVVELAHRFGSSVAAIAAVDGGTIELSSRFETWEACAVQLAPPQLEGTPVAQVEAWMRATHADWPESGIQGSLANMEVLPDGTVRPWLSRANHLAVLRGLYDHHPSQLWAGIDVPVAFIAADDGVEAWTESKRAAIDAAVEALPRGRARWFSPAHHDVHAQFPTEVAAELMTLAAEAGR